MQLLWSRHQQSCIQLVSAFNLLRQHGTPGAAGDRGHGVDKCYTISMRGHIRLPEQVLCGREVVVCGAIGPAASMRKAGPRVAEVAIGDGACRAELVVPLRMCLCMLRRVRPALQMLVLQESSSPFDHDPYHKLCPDADFWPWPTVITHNKLSARPGLQSHPLIHLMPTLTTAARAGGTTAWKMCCATMRSSLVVYFDITASHAAAVPDGTPFFLQVCGT